MGEIIRLQPVTRVRGEMMPSPALQRAIDAFTDEPGNVGVYTSAQMYIPRGEHRTRHAGEFSRIEREFAARQLGQQVLGVARLVRLTHNEDGSGRLVFGLDRKSQVMTRYFARRIGVVEGREGLEYDDDTIYAQLAAGALAQNLRDRDDQVREAAGLLASQLRHPTARRQMTVAGLHIVTHDTLRAVRDE